MNSIEEEEAGTGGRKDRKEMERKKWRGGWVWERKEEDPRMGQEVTGEEDGEEMKGGRVGGRREKRRRKGGIPSSS